VQLRKAERRNEDLKMDCEELEEQISQMSAELRHAHEDQRRLAAVEDELATAKQISIKLHDECERLNAHCQLYRLGLDDNDSTQASLQPVHLGQPDLRVDMGTENIITVYNFLRILYKNLKFL